MSKTSKKLNNIVQEPIEIEKKYKEVMELADTIKLYDKHLISKDKQSRIVDLYSRMDFRLRELLNESQIKEADIKITIFSEILEILKEKNVLE